jgi:hypothetical protein
MIFWFVFICFVLLLIYLLVSTLLMRLHVIAKDVVDYYWTKKKQIMLELTSDVEMPITRSDKFSSH